MIPHRKLVVRFDDVTPTMAWSNFSVFDDLSRSLGIRFLVGVIPECRDPTLAIEPARRDFWDVVRGWKRRGWTVAQHGYTHEYVTRDGGVLGISMKSEFAGLPRAEQHRKLALGKEILEREGVWAPVFMAPSHSFDWDTLAALAALGFSRVTDGYGVYPYRLGPLTAVPVLTESALFDWRFGVATMCLHVNSMTRVQVERTAEVLRSRADQIVSFDEACAARPRVPGLAALLRWTTRAALRTARSVRSRWRAPPPRSR